MTLFRRTPKVKLKLQVVTLPAITKKYEIDWVCTCRTIIDFTVSPPIILKDLVFPQQDNIDLLNY